MEKHEVIWICEDCAKKYSNRQFRYSTWHGDICDVCGERKAVTEPRDFYLNASTLTHWNDKDEQQVK